MTKKKPKRIVEWEASGPTRRDTLTQCPACNAKGKKLLEHEKGRYQMITCRWCNGLGGITRSVQQKWIRLQLILLHRKRIFGE